MKKRLKSTAIKDGKARARSIRAEGFSAASLSISNSYLVPFALAIKSSNFLIGLLTSVTELLSPLAQIYSARSIQHQPRKNIVLKSSFLQVIAWLAIVLIAALAMFSIIPNFLPILLLLAYTSLSIFSSYGAPAWFSWMGDLVSEEKRGKFLSKRLVMRTIVGILLVLLLSFFMDYAKKYNFLLMGFIIVFGIATIAKYTNHLITRKIYEPKLATSNRYYFSLWQFIKRINRTNFGNFVLYTAFLYFFVMIASPFFAVYMLKDLGFSYLQFVFVSLGASLSTILFMPIIGKFADRFGNSRILHFGGWLIPLVPLAWLFSPSPYYLFAIEFIFSGLAWSAFNLGSSNYIYDTVSSQKRGFAVAYYSILAGIGSFLGSLAGGFLAQYLSISFMNIFLFIFLISAVGRLIVSIIFLPRIHEVRKVKKFAFSKIHPIHEISHQLRLGARSMERGVLSALG